MFRSSLLQFYKRPYPNINSCYSNQFETFLYHKSFLRHSPNFYLISSQKKSNFAQQQSISSNVSSYVPLPIRLVNNAPPPFQPYLRLMRLDKPIGTWLILLPTLWSAAMAIPYSLQSSASHTLLTDSSTALGLTGLGFDPLVCLSLAVGAIAMRGAGCTVNDYLDRDIDARVERTRNRPMVSGQVSPFGALVLLGGQLSLALVSLLTFNWYTVFLAPFILPVVFAYPLFKRVTYWPQVVLGVALNYGALVGFSSVAGYCDWSVCLPLYAAGISWTLVYDTIYAHQDREDDALVGVKSTALRFPTLTSTRLALSTFASAMIGSLGLTAVNAGLHWPFYAALAGATLQLGWQIGTLDIRDGGNCLRRYSSNRLLGLLLLLGFIGSNLVESH